MKDFISSRFIGYYIFIVALFAVISYALAKEMTDYFMMVVIFGVIFIIVTAIFAYMTRIYIKPIQELSKSIHSLMKGRYDEVESGSARGEVGELMDQIHLLAMDLDEVMDEQRIQSDQLSAIIENAGSGLLLLDAQGFVLYVNKKFASIFGDCPKNYVKKRYYTAFQNESIHQIIKQTYFDEQEVKDQTQVNHLHIDVLGVPIFSESNQMMGMVLVIYDITEFKRLDTMRKDFVANVSHELKTPITSIKGFAETLLTSGAKDKEVRDNFLQIILRESERMQELIDQLLLLSKMESQNPSLGMSSISVKSFIKGIEPLFIQHAKEKKLELDILIDEDLDLKVDEQGFTQVLVNLLMNAIIYTPEGGKVQFSVKGIGNRIKFTVRDTGIGIPEEEIPRIFERFYRVDQGRARSTGGTGLGLSIAKHIIEAHDGEISVQSPLGEGTLVTFTLPKEGPKIT